MSEADPRRKRRPHRSPKPVEYTGQEPSPFADEIIRFIQEHGENTEGSILLNDYGNGLYVPHGYIKEFLDHIPKLDDSHGIHMNESTDTWLEARAQRAKDMEILKRRLGLGEEEVLHTSHSLYEDEHHRIFPSSQFPAVFYHSLGVRETGGAYGNGGEFLTVNLTSDRIRELASQSGAQRPRPPK